MQIEFNFFKKTKIYLKKKRNRNRKYMKKNSSYKYDFLQRSRLLYRLNNFLIINDFQ
jgi:hypothetical protein